MTEVLERTAGLKETTQNGAVPTLDLKAEGVTSSGSPTGAVTFGGRVYPAHGDPTGREPGE